MSHHGRLSFMPAFPNLWLAAVPGLGMVLVALASVLFWRRFSAAGLRWFWGGAALWTFAVAVKVAVGYQLSPPVVGWLKSSVSPAAFVVFASLYVGAFSSLCEIGLTFLAVKLWPRLGDEPDKSIAVGIGSGAFEALLLGLAALVKVGIAVSSGPESEEVRQQMAATQATLPLFWLLQPVERVLALLAHVGCRALVLLGSVRRRWGMVIAGFLIFAAVDSVAGAYYLSQTKASLWWAELAIVPFAIVGLQVTRWCRGLEVVSPADAGATTRATPPAKWPG